MEPQIIKRLKKPEQDEKLKKLLSDVLDKVKTSRSVMSERFSQWDANNDVYRGIRPPDKDDLEAAKRNEPEKMVIPMTFAQIQTQVAFEYLLMMQHAKLFQMDAPKDDGDYSIRWHVDGYLDRDMRANCIQPKLYQMLIDKLRFGLGIFKSYWANEKVSLPANQSRGVSHGISLDGDDVVYKDAVKYEGNRVINLSPYRWYPDTRYPLTEWRRGQFAGDEREYDKTYLRELEGREEIIGMEFVEPFTRAQIDQRTGTRLPKLVDEMARRDGEKRTVCITEVQIKLNAKAYGLGTDSQDRMFLLWIANDNRIVRIDRYNYAHQEFSYDVAQYSPDMHQKINTSLADTLFPMQDHNTWLINSRMWNVKRNIDGRMVIDPEIVDVDSLRSHLSPYIWLRKGAPKIGNTNMGINQLQYIDVTAKHMEDANMLMNLMQVVTGVNEAAMGQFHSGRRSATEARAVQSGAAGRMKVSANNSWWECMNPMGHKCMINARQELSYDTFEKIFGATTPDTDVAYELFHVDDVTELVNNEDFFIFDSTIDSEKGFVAQSLQELVQVILANPETAQMFDINPKALIDEIMELRGVGKLSRFSFSNGQLPQPIQPGVEGNPQLPQAAPAVAGV